MDKLETDIKTFCFSAPCWMQLEYQAIWYGLLSTLITYKEDNIPFIIKPTIIEDLLLYVDPEFDQWPTSWLEPTVKEFLELNYSLEQLNECFEKLDTVFRDCIPTDLNIFTIFANGDTLTKEQWIRLYNAIAFLPSSPQLKKNKKGAKTRHINGRRAITPMKNRRASTRKAPIQYSFIKLQ